MHVALKVGKLLSIASTVLWIVNIREYFSADCFCPMWTLENTFVGPCGILIPLLAYLHMCDVVLLHTECTKEQGQDAAEQWHVAGGESKEVQGTRWGQLYS